MPAIASGLDLVAPLSRRNGGASAEPGQRLEGGGGGAPPPPIASLIREARASAQAEAQAGAARSREPDDRRLAARASQAAADLSVDDPRFPVFPPAFPVESLILAFDRGIAAYRATQALGVAARPQLKLAGGETGVPTTA